MPKDTVRIGTISELKIKAKLLELGVTNLLNPVTNAMPYDLALDMGDHIIKIQIKTGRLRNGVIIFNTCGIMCNMTKTVRKEYVGKIDYFAVYCPNNQGYYIISIKDIAKSSMNLRIEPTKNGNRKKINWAKDYELEKVINTIIN